MIQQYLENSQHWIIQNHNVNSPEIPEPAKIVNMVITLYSNEVLTHQQHLKSPRWEIITNDA